MPRTQLLQPCQIELCQFVNLQRGMTNRVVGIKNRQVRKDIDIGLMGIMGELAFGLYFHFFPDLTWEPRKLNPDLPASKDYDFKLLNGKTFDIKTTDKDAMTVNQRKAKNRSADYYVMCRTKMPDFTKDLEPHPVEIMGYLTPRGVQEVGTLMNADRNGYYSVHHELLKPLTRKQYA